MLHHAFVRTTLKFWMCIQGLKGHSPLPASRPLPWTMHFALGDSSCSSHTIFRQLFRAPAFSHVCSHLFHGLKVQGFPVQELVPSHHLIVIVARATPLLQT